MKRGPRSAPALEKLEGAEMGEISVETKVIQCKTAVAAGTTDITDATAVDTQGYEGVRFFFSFGAITSGAATSVAVAGKATSSPTPGTDDLTGSKITVLDTDDDKVFVLDIYKPVQRYIRPFVKRATQNSVVNCIIAELYGAKKQPLGTQDTSVGGQETWTSPAVGTA
jgi:hypothetical protein